MNDLLFYALLLALLYYFFYYLPQQKKSISNQSLTKPLTQTQFTQTELDPKRTIEYEPGPSDTLSCPGPITKSEEMKKLEKAIQQKEKTIIDLNNSYNKLETKNRSTNR